MQTLRQLGGGVIIAIFSVILVIGGIFLSLAETLPPPATPTQIPPTFPQSFPTPTATTIGFPATQTAASESPTATATLALAVPSPTSCTPPSGWILITTGAGDTVYTLAQRYKTTAESLNAANCLTAAELPAGIALYVPPVPTVTVIPCGPPFGWVRNYVVQRGDTLSSIAFAYNITYPQLQRGNCMGNSTTIYAGQRLWVPNVAPRTPVIGTTTIPEFPTDTPVTPTTTPPPTDTPTEPPTATEPPSPTPPPTITDTPPSPPPAE
jgi:LysM repeat protein